MSIPKFPASPGRLLIPIVTALLALVIWALWPLYPEEMNLKLTGKFDELIDKLGESAQTELINPTRPNLAKKKGWLGR